MGFCRAFRAASIVALAAGGALLGASGPSDPTPPAAETSVTGWVSDEACGATHTKPGGADCVRKCLRGGASVGHPEWKPQRMVFVADEGHQIWIVENPETLKGHEGDRLRVSGMFDQKGKVVRVREAAPAPDSTPPK